MHLRQHQRKGSPSERLHTVQFSHMTFSFATTSTVLLGTNRSVGKCRRWAPRQSFPQESTVSCSGVGGVESVVKVGNEKMRCTKLVRTNTPPFQPRYTRSVRPGDLHHVAQNQSRGTNLSQSFPQPACNERGSTETK